MASPSSAVLDIGFWSLPEDLIDEINDAMLSAHVSVTGTRFPLPHRQAATLRLVLGELHDEGPRVLHHGMCTGADQLAHYCALDLGWQIHGHPGPPSKWRMPVNPLEFAVLHPVKPFLVRDVDIAVAGGRLVAAPAFPEHHPRSRASGTWATVRLARTRHRPITYVWPDGSTEEDPGE